MKRPEYRTVIRWTFTLLAPACLSFSILTLTGANLTGAAPAGLPDRMLIAARGAFATLITGLYAWGQWRYHKRLVRGGRSG